MKASILTMVILSFSLISCKISGQKSLKSNQKETKSFELADFSQIHVMVGIEVELKPGNANYAVATSNFMEYLRLEVKGDKLEIHYDQPLDISLINSETKIQLSAKNIDFLKASSSGEIKVKGDFPAQEMSVNVSSSGEIAYDFSGDFLNVNASSSGDFTGNIKVNDLKINASSSSDVVLKGEAVRTLVNASSSADVDLSELTSIEAVVNASSSADVLVLAEKDLNLNATSGADIQYKIKDTNQRYKNINVNESEYSGGDIKKVRNF